MRPSPKALFEMDWMKMPSTTKYEAYDNNEVMSGRRMSYASMRKRMPKKENAGWVG